MFISFSQTETDSLLQKLKSCTKDDTVKAILLGELAFQYTHINTDSALMFARQGTDLSEKLKYDDGIVSNKNVFGLVYRDIGRTDEAIKIYEELIEIRKRQGKTEKLISCYGNLAGVYLVQKNFAKAIKNYQWALEQAKKTGNKKMQLMLMGNMALAYQAIGEMDKALDLLDKSIQLNKELKDELEEAVLLTNTALIYKSKDNVEGAIENFKRAQKIYLQFRYLKGYLDNSVNLMNCYNQQKKFELTLSEANAAEKICIEISDSIYLGDVYICKANALGALHRFDEVEPLLQFVIATGEKYQQPRMVCVGYLVYSDFYKEFGKLDKALECDLKAVKIAAETNEPEQLKECYHSLYEIYNLKKDYKNSVIYLEKVQAINDSLNTDDFNSKLANLKSLYDLDAKEKEIDLLTKNKALDKEKLARQNTMIIAAAGGGVFLLLFFFLSYRAYRRKKKDNVILSSQKQEIEFKNNVLEEKNNEIIAQKDLIEEKNKEILDSINYARRIQHSLLASDAMLSKNLSEYFVLYKPKDIVSGDFYWATELRKLRPGKMFSEKGSSEAKGVNEASEFILVCGDCTGHGVPGAFMSLLNISKLNETINEKRINRPGPVLDAVRKEIISVLNPEGETENNASAEVKDGMDCTLLRFDLDTMTLNYAAANNSFYLVRNGQLHICPADKMPIGKSPNDKNPFSTYSFSLEKGDLIYLLTDGYPDQFGGPKGKKFKYKPFQELMTSNFAKPLSDQKTILENTFSDWKGKLEQIDDVLVIGIRI